jgi:hypothetical protein
VKWRDGQAMLAWQTLSLARPNQKPAINLVMMDAVLKDYYNQEALVERTFTESPVYAFLKKKVEHYGGTTVFCTADERVPPNRAYLVPISFLPEPRHVGVLPVLRDAEGDHTERGGSEEDEQETAPLCSQGPSEAGALPRKR